MATNEPERCAYCGRILDASRTKTRDHVFPQNLYPLSRRGTYAPITVPACNCCNQRWSDHEEHFRNVVNSAGDFNPAAEEVWFGKIKRSLSRPAGKRRIRELLNITEAVQANGATRLKIYPAEDPRVLDVIRKIVVGLCHHHDIVTALSMKRIWADVLRFRVPDEYLDLLNHGHCEVDIVEYWYGVRTEPGLHSVWILRFFGRTPFISVVSDSEDGAFPWECEARPSSGAGKR